MPNNALALSRVLNGRVFVVPDYQRPYAWEQRQLEDMWQDLDLMADGAKHYTGTLVLKELEKDLVTDGGDSLTICDVVDGQQRLTTCLILVDQLRRALSQIDHDLARERAEHLARTYGPLTVAGQAQARLRLGEDLNDHWVHVILGEGQQGKPSLTAGERRLSDAAAFFKEQIAALHAGMSTDAALSALQRLQTRVTTGLRFLTYEVEPESHAGEVFETLNGRGRDLTDMEKIKNYLLFLADTLPPDKAQALARSINKAWSEIYELLARQDADENTLLRSHWLATYEPMARYWKGAPSVKQRFSREKYVPGSSRLTTGGTASPADVEPLQTELMDSVRAYVMTLRDCAMFTLEFLDPQAQFQQFGPDRELTASAQSASARLRRSGVTAVFRPLLFAARLRHGSNGAFYVDLINACERYAARVFVMGQKRATSGQSRLYRLAHDLYEGDDPEQVLDEINALTWYHADDDVVRAAFGPKKQWYWRTQGHKYFLYEYELSKAVRHGDVKDFETYAAGARSKRTTEHILPQNPAWDSGEWTSFSLQQHADLVHGIGNLVLTDDNSSYGNKPFAAKRGAPGQGQACYAKSFLVQERDLALLEEWTPATLDDRRHMLMEWALERWPATAPAAPVQAEEDSDEDSGAMPADEAALPGTPTDEAKDGIA